MKVNNSKLGGAGPKLDGLKGSKAEGAHGLNGDLKTGSLPAKTLRESSNVDVSGRAQTMKAARTIAGSMSIDEAKVARLQKLIDAGEYKVDAEAVADRLVDEHLMTSE